MFLCLRIFNSLYFIYMLYVIVTGTAGFEVIPLEYLQLNSSIGETIK